MSGLHFRLIPSSSACTSLLPPFAGGPLGLWPSGSTPAQPVSVGTPGRATPGSRGEHHHRAGEPAAPRGSGSCGRLPRALADGTRAQGTRLRQHRPLCGPDTELATGMPIVLFIGTTVGLLSFLHLRLRDFVLG